MNNIKTNDELPAHVYKYLKLNDFIKYWIPNGLSFSLVGSYTKTIKNVPDDKEFFFKVKDFDNASKCRYFNKMNRLHKDLACKKSISLMDLNGIKNNQITQIFIKPIRESMRVCSLGRTENNSVLAQRYGDGDFGLCLVLSKAQLWNDFRSYLKPVNYSETPLVFEPDEFLANKSDCEALEQLKAIVWHKSTDYDDEEEWRLVLSNRCEAFENEKLVHLDANKQYAFSTKLKTYLHKIILGKDVSESDEKRLSEALKQHGYGDVQLIRRNKSIISEKNEPKS